MALLPRFRPNNPIISPLRYSDRYDYPLNLSELWYWQIRTRLSLSQINNEVKSLGKLGQLEIRNYICLPHRSHVISLRRNRQMISRQKWLIANRVGDSLRRIPTIRAVFITGALAMNNCPENDDIDIMVITIPHALWITRFILYLYLYLKSWRRSPQLPEHSSPRVRDKICDNLYLDTCHLSITRHNLYQAHEILQAKPLFDKSSIHNQFLKANPWVSDYLPVAYRELLKKSSQILNHESSNMNQLSWLLFPINLLFYFGQYLYMRPKITSEHIGLGFAFFHPISPTPHKSQPL